MTATPEARRVCLVVVSLVHYHDARFDCFGRSGSAVPHVVELTDKDEVPELECQPARDRAYRRHTLFPGAAFEALSRRALRQALWRCLDEVQPDVICLNGWSLPGSVETLEWGLTHRTPAIVLSESSERDFPRRGWKEAAKACVVRLCAAGFVGGTLQAEYLTRLGMPRERVFTGYAAVDNEHFRRGADTARQQEHDWRDRLGLAPRYFLASARFTRKKNLPRLLKAYAAYRQQAGRQAWDLVILGDGPLRGELLALRRALGVEDAVALPGFKSYTELPAYYGLAGAFVHASTSEQWGLVINEAMAAGLPVLVSERCGCAPDLVETGRTGFTFDPYDVEGLAGLMLKMAGEGCDRRAMGQASRERIARWGPEAFAAGISKAVETALQVPRPAASLSDRALLRVLTYRRVSS